MVYGDEDHAQKVLLADLVADLGPKLLGDELWDRYHKWPMYSKFFDNQGPLPHHLHQRSEHAALVGAEGKPEGYFFPVQLNNHGGDFPHTFLIRFYLVLVRFVRLLVRSKWYWCFLLLTSRATRVVCGMQGLSDR